MAKFRRNGPCTCGSGSKAKRCCNGNDRATEVHCLPSEILMEVEPDLADIDWATFRSLFAKAHYLPGTHTRLRLRLETLTPAEGRAIQAILSQRVDVPDEATSGFVFEVIGEVQATVDSPTRRIELARAVLSLRDEGRIPPDVAAVAVLELDREMSTLFAGSVLASLLPLDWERRTPSATPGEATGWKGTELDQLPDDFSQVRRSESGEPISAATTSAAGSS